MEPLDEITKQLRELRRENTKQFGELRREIAQLKEKQGDILAKLESGKPPLSHKEKRPVDEKEGQARTFETYCSECFELRPITEPRQVELPDGSLATQGKCAVCGTTVFRMAAMTGVLVSDAAAAALRIKR